MDELLSPMILGGLTGYFVGALIKWILHLALIIGIFAFLFFHMTYTDVIDLRLDKIIATIGKYTEVLSQLGLAALVSNSLFVGGFILGLILGLKGWRAFIRPCRLRG